ncbi:uncharacterized protein GGS22DRAFT_198502 [Annulohypoxylon maeteangense]|uniref:uncharacterized protein n=1 Tax=Annulohypoxylon maeteangense TaxID=1927788 RepID=UPI002008E3C7|nr:uncharacterized protein GGS22DRAFT_198502 [Annulohypoxylon maeteangense]KAI0879915.1 hypothetical protein GGS22DRAFT_198502 [Annulohypoxylon maeteangense]
MATASHAAPALARGNGYKCEWARYVARRTLAEDLDNVKVRIRSVLESDRSTIPGSFHIPTHHTSVNQFLRETKSLTGLGLVAPEQGNIKIGIIGAGVAGLFTAMLFDWLNSTVKGLNIDYDLIEAAYTATLVSNALKEFIEMTHRKLDERRAAPPDDFQKEEKFWKFLMKADNMSVRQFLASIDNGPLLPQGPGYNFTIEWLETAIYGTGWYNQSLSECVLEELDFDVDNDEALWCIDGGTQTVAHLMESQIERPVQLHSRVIAINANISKRASTKEHVPMTLTIKKTDPDAMKTETRAEDYFAVFNSTTLGALQQMNIKDAGLLWGTKQAIRTLGYGASCKVTIKFSRAWWQVEPFNIDRFTAKKRPSVLLCSYTWGQDAQKLGSLISRRTPEDEEQLKSVVLHSLALLHANDAKPYDTLLFELQRDYVTHHAWDWYHDENMSGAFAYFGPGQFSSMWEEIIKPNAFGQLYLVGEAASSHHGWIVGALESVVRATYTMLKGLQSGDPGYKPYQEAMDLLNPDPNKPAPPPSPFYPLPGEMPR